MNFPFMAAISYLTPKQKEAFEQFLAEQPEFETLYINNSGEVKQVTKIEYPKGCVTKDTVFITVKDVVRYHTPLADVDGQFAVVYWMSEDRKKHGKMTSEEWFEWVGTDYKTRAATPPRPDQDLLRDRKVQEARNAMILRKQKAEREVKKLTPKAQGGQKAQ